ncbi:hypothetical protein AJ80_04466 [Polytolypa hystricis UAMH7299]|uniref:Pentatricopeptide repeat domain-containing protein n=1 Tax=Polytolypa hystricis (strain UAMH7299) TaxID=1447883 RepID=A0A2B7YAE1_POLH7|nr:hypothetical protein AJ80_04466 [Polytolypa hystricis UAMH7299]
MRRLSLWGTRWHQHGVSGSRLRHASDHRPPVWRPFTSTTTVLGAKDRKPEVTVRHYEQSTLDSKDRVDIEDESRSEQEWVLSQIHKLQEEVKELKKGPYSPNSPWMQKLPERERELVLGAIREYEAEHGKIEDQYPDEELLDPAFEKMFKEESERDFEEATRQEDEEIMGEEEEELPSRPKEPFEVELKVPDSHFAYVNRFNKALKALSKDQSRTHRQEVWKSYRRCKEAIPSFLETVPEATLNMLWGSQVVGPQHANFGNWELLAEDIMSSNRDLTRSQWLEYIEMLYHVGKVDKALQLWKARQEVSIPDLPDHAEKYWKLGIQLYIAKGEVQTAQDTALAFLAKDGPRYPRILIPIIIAWSKMPGDENGARAWALYLRLKTMLKDNINMADYDAVSVGLLKADRTDLALAAFKDMMLTGQNSSSDSTALYNGSRGLVGSLHSSAITESDVNKISLAALTILPRRFQNKFFYASWLKKLIGMGEVNSAAAVVELMYERGVKPDAKHLNGIIAAWLRQGSPASRGKAERLAWALVKARLAQFAPENQSIFSAQQESIEHPTSSAEDNVRILKFVQRNLPAASIETFSILLLHYTRRGREDMANHVIECLERARLRPNSFFMNHLLFAELRKHDILAVWRRYKEMASTIRPDLETFACLWDCGKVQFDRSRRPYDPEFPSARALYAEMLSWFARLSPHAQQTVRSEFSADLYNQITRCFCLSLDPQGTIVALRSLNEIFGFVPDEDTIRLIMFHVVRLTPTPPGTPKNRRRRISTTPRSKENFDQVGKLIDMLKNRKAILLAKQNIKLEDLDEETQDVLQIELMSELFRLILSRIAPKPDKVEESIRIAAAEMGVGDLYLGEPLDMASLV